MENSFKSPASPFLETWREVSSIAPSPASDEAVDLLAIKDEYYQLMEKLRVNNVVVTEEEIAAYQIQHEKALRYLDLEGQEVLNKLCNLQLLLAFYTQRGLEAWDESFEDLNSSYETYYDSLIVGLSDQLDTLMEQITGQRLPVSERGNYAYSLNKIYYELDLSQRFIQIDLNPIFANLSIESIPAEESVQDISVEEIADNQQAVTQAMTRWIERKLGQTLTQEQKLLISHTIQNFFLSQNEAIVSPKSSVGDWKLSNSPYRFQYEAREQRAFSEEETYTPAGFGCENS